MRLGGTQVLPRQWTLAARPKDKGILMPYHIDSPNWKGVTLSFLGSGPGTSGRGTSGINSISCNIMIHGCPTQSLVPSIYLSLTRTDSQGFRWRISALPCPDSPQWTPPILLIYRARLRLWFPQAHQKKPKLLFHNSKYGYFW
jgi:hypothetical protein